HGNVVKNDLITHSFAGFGHRVNKFSHSVLFYRYFWDAHAVFTADFTDVLLTDFEGSSARKLV
ncbi:MAG: hypothetical protein ACFNL3_06315, partial [Rothia aeria]